MLESRKLPDIPLLVSGSQNMHIGIVLRTSEDFALTAPV